METTRHEPFGLASQDRLIDEPTPSRVSDGLEPVMRTQLAIYVVEVVPKGLGGDVQCLRYGCGVAAFRKEGKDSALLVG
jgi:hypothetical protein